MASQYHDKLVDFLSVWSVDRMNNTSISVGQHPRKTRIVEIVGPAGAWKTTLCQAMAVHTDTIKIENFPDVRKTSDAPFFISNGLKLIPNLLRLSRSNSRQLTRREFAWLSILNGWSSLLQKEANNGNKVIILDQGPIYLLAEMRLFGPEYLKEKAAERLWQNLFDCWKATLQMVVWLDTDNETLLERIRTREQEHIVKTQAEANVYKFLDRYRAEYDFILSSLTAKGSNLKVIKFDTGRQQAQGIEKHILSEISSSREIN